MKDELHIIPHNHKVTRLDREKIKEHRGVVLWFVGLSGSGKSTLAGKVEQYLYAKGYHTYLLDGDNVRTGLNKDLDFSESSRTENIRRISEVAKLMVDAGLITIVSFISPLAKDRTHAKETIGKDDFNEIYVECPIEECEKRDVKGLYALARKGFIKDFTGISSPFEGPQNPDVLVNTLEMDEKKCLESVIKYLKDKL